jgi:hypothetical protein
MPSHEDPFVSTLAGILKERGYDVSEEKIIKLLGDFSLGEALRSVGAKPLEVGEIISAMTAHLRLTPPNTASAEDIPEEKLPFREYITLIGEGAKELYSIKAEQTKLSIDWIFRDSRRGNSTLRWEFNNAGRITSVQLNSHTLINARPSLLDPNKWDRKEIKIRPLRYDIFTALPEILNTPNFLAYQRLLNQGHVRASRLLDALEDSSAQTPSQRKGSQEPFANLFMADRIPYEIMKKAAAIRPVITRNISHGRTTVLYVPREVYEGSF